ncbi:MAG: cytochrome b/b6 domain-containing protein [Gammaproteobacteria bacterium]|nr:cytochrome b/b6 domain-containing protein [Gammaproteobacteria bacterium]
MSRILIWDIPTRIFHWSLALAFAAAWLSSLDNRFLYAHTYAGYAFLGLLLFRLWWGVVGSRYARFRAFAYDWPSVRAYLAALATGRATRYLGHNPAGSWSILFLLALGLMVSTAGVLVLGGEEGHGPLAGYIPFQAGDYAHVVHEAGAWLMLAVVTLHIGGVVIESTLHGENLVRTMITGYKKNPGGPGAGVRAAGTTGAILLATLITAGLIYLKGYLMETPEQPYVPYSGPMLPDNATWRSECGDCHLAFHPSLLPVRSWRRMMLTLSDHFGEDVALDAGTAAEIEAFLTANAAEALASEPAHRILASIAADQIPLRVTDTVYWKRKHSGIDDKYWTAQKVGHRSNCKGCHLDADAGTFEDAGMRLPVSAAADASRATSSNP